MYSVSDSAPVLGITAIPTEVPVLNVERRERLARSLQIVWVVLSGNTVKGMTAEEAGAIMERVKAETDSELFTKLVNEVASVARDPMQRAAMCLNSPGGEEIDLRERPGLCANIQNLLSKYKQ